MKQLVIILIAILATTTYAKGKRLKSFCGFEFGSANTHPLQLDTVDKPLPKPFMRFTKATLMYGIHTKKLDTILLTGDYPVGTAFSTVKNDATKLMDMLKEKYGLKFTHMEAKENRTVVFDYSTDSSSDTIIDIAIFKAGPIFMLNVTARDKILQDEGNGGSLLKRQEGYDVL